MRCTRAREYICSNRDGALDEQRRIELQKHLASCPACAEWCGEMDQCMEMIGRLPDAEPSENFEWNIKRRIAMERARALRRETASPFASRAWGSRFLAGAAAALVVFIAGAWLITRSGPDGPGIPPQAAGRTASAAPRSGEIHHTTTGYPAGIRYVSDDPLGGVPDGERERRLPFTMAVDPRVDYLLRENELLRRQVDDLSRRNRYLQGLVIEQRRLERGR
ncbi:MAG: zf-HC2 domain-containing protein [Candidatus Krumholzibacteria bacterium]|nr:zf-HC2 domain-containing protein [Candidatus Krumholzibacteria bacterium]